MRTPTTRGPIWDNFRGLFRWVNEGNPKQEIARYNGGMFAADELLDQLTVPDDGCQALGQAGLVPLRAPTGRG